MAHADDEEAVLAMAAELVTKGPLALTLRPLTVMQLAGLIQLALRHPQLTGSNRATATHFLAGVLDYFADCPATLDVLHRGNDPQEDR